MAVKLLLSYQVVMWLTYRKARLLTPSDSLDMQRRYLQHEHLDRVSGIHRSQVSLISSLCGLPGKA